MAKNAYLVITDWHRWYKNLRSRFNYVSEIDFVYSKILDVATKYKIAGYSVKFLFLGDLFHNGYSDTFTAVRDNNLFIKLQDDFGDIYTVVGNHELSYYSNNPFYTLMKEMSSEKLEGIVNKVWTPVGVKSVIRVVDQLNDGDVHFYFNHYSTPVSIPESSGVNIGLFHSDIVSPQVKQKAEEKLGIHVYTPVMDVEGSGILNGYNYCFMGHMHQMYGTYLTSNGTYLCYLGSLGRTNIAEVDDNFLERDIPVICVENGKLSSVDNNKFNLPSRAECVNEELVNMFSEAYEEQKERAAVREYVPTGDDPVQNVIAALGNDVVAVDIVHALMYTDIDEHGIRIFREVESCGN